MVLAVTVEVEGDWYREGSGDMRGGTTGRRGQTGGGSRVKEGNPRRAVVAEGEADAQDEALSIGVEHHSRGTEPWRGQS